jgi:hypothetical protein
MPTNAPTDEVSEVKPSTPQTAEQMVRALEASIAAVAPSQREQFDAALDTVTNAIALAREAVYDAMELATSPEAREGLEMLMASLRELSDATPAQSSSGLMCEIYEAAR